MIVLAKKGEREEEKRGTTKTITLSLSPDLEKSIPRSCTKSITVVIDAKTADSVLVALKGRNLLSLESVPDVTVKVVVASEHETTRDGVGH